MIAIKCRKKLNSVFGDTVQIKLDLFHAAQCITRKLQNVVHLFISLEQHRIRASINIIMKIKVGLEYFSCIL